MGLKKDTPEVPGEAGSAPAAAQTPPQKPPAQKPPVAKAAAKKEEGKSVILLAIHRPLADPFSGILYNLTEPKPAQVLPGNWVDCQMKAGLLTEYTAPAGDS